MGIKEDVFDYLTEKKAIDVSSSITFHTLAKELKLSIKSVNGLNYYNVSCFISVEKFKNRLAFYLSGISLEDSVYLRRKCHVCGSSFYNQDSLEIHSKTKLHKLF